MSHMSERDELNDVIARSRSGIAEHLIEMGVKPDAAAKAVFKQVKFGRAPNGAVLMKRGAWVASAISYQKDCATHILSSIPPEDRKDFSDGDEEDEMWASAEKRLYDSNPVLSREQLLERKREP